MQRDATAEERGLSLGCILLAVALIAGCRNTSPQIYEWDASGGLDVPVGEWLGRQELHPPVYHGADSTCDMGIVVPPGMCAAPDYYAYVGADHKHMILPVTQDPRAVLEDGDILIYQLPIHRQPSDYTDFYAAGKLHCAWVFRNEDRPFHIDAPRSLSGENFTSHPSDYPAFHIIRLRKYPAGVRNVADLQAWQQDPIRKEQLVAFAARRTRTIAKIREYVLGWSANGYAYDSSRRTEYSSFGRSWLACGTSAPPLYCSEIIGMALERAGVRLPPSGALHHAVSCMERSIRGANDADVESLEQIALDAMFSRPFLVDAGATDRELNAWERDDVLSCRFELARKHMRSLLRSDPEARVSKQWSADNLALPLFGGGLPIAVADLFDCIYHPDSPLVYVGTWVGENGAGLNPTIGGPLRDSQAAVPAPIHSLQLHIFPIDSLSVDASGRFAVSCARDETIRLLDLDGLRTRTVVRQRHFTSARFAPEGGFVIAEDARGRVVRFAAAEVPRSEQVHPSRCPFDVHVEGSLVVLRRGAAQLEFRHQARVRAAVVSSNGQRLLTATGTALHIFDLENIRSADAAQQSASFGVIHGTQRTGA